MKKATKLSLSLILLFSLAIVTSSCQRDESDIIAYVIFLGDPNVSDSCGWLIETERNTRRFKPLNLPESFEEEGLRILVSFEIESNSIVCGLGQNYREITITDISLF